MKFVIKLLRNEIFKDEYILKMLNNKKSFNYILSYFRLTVYDRYLINKVIQQSTRGDKIFEGVCARGN